MLAGWVTYLAFVVLASIVYGPNLFGVVTDPSWLVGVFMLGPAVGLSSVVAGRRRQRPGQRPAGGAADRRHHRRPDHRGDPAPGDRHAAGGGAGYILLAAIVLVLSLLGLRAGVALFDREAILTRWR